MKKRFSKLLSFLLSLCMILSMASMTVFADEAEEAASTDPVYYVKWGGTGNGLSPESPVATVADAVTKINAAGYGAGDTVTVYIMNDDTLTDEQTAGNAHGKDEPWWYDANGNYFTSFVKNTARRHTAWASRAGSAGSYTATLVIKGYTDDAKLFSSTVTGDTAHIYLGGPTVFEDLTIVHTRMYDVTMFARSNDLTFNDVTFMYQDACNANGSGTPNIKDGHHRVSPTDSTSSVKGMTITYNTPLPDNTNSDTRYGAIVPGNYATTFTSHMKWYFNGNSTNGQVPWGIATSKFNDGLSVVANAGTYSQVKRDSKVTTVTGGLQIVNNNGASFGTVPTDVVAADETWYMNSADTTGNALDVTDTAGTFTVKGGNIAWVMTSDNKTVYYSVGGKLTVPAGTYAVNYASSVDEIIENATPFEDAANEFVEWLDNGSGTLTGAYRATGEDVCYYVQQGAAGSGLTEANPGSFATVISAINKNYGAGDTVIIKIVRCANDEITSIADVTEEKVNELSFPAVSSIPAHEATIVLTSADTANRSIVSFNNGFSLKDNMGGNINFSGPTIFKDIDVVDSRINHYWDMYAIAYDVKVDSGVNWYRPKKSSTTYTVKGTPYTGGIGGGARDTRTFVRPYTIEFADGSFSNFTYFNYTGYNTTGTMTFDEDATFKFGTGTAAAITLDNMNGGSSLFKKNVNLVLNGTTATSFVKGSKSAGTVVQGAIQIIKNNGATIGTNSASAYTSTANNAATPIYDITVENGVTLDVTETAGVYTVAGNNIAYVQSADLKTVYYSVDGVLTLPSAGTWTIKNAADMDALKATLAIPTYSIQHTFKEWVDDGNGIITDSTTVNTDPEIFKYYVQYGATGTGLTINSPAGTIKAAIEAVNADGWGKGDNVTVYLVPTGNEPTLEQLNYKNTTQGNPPIKLGEANGFIYFQTPNVSHTATITYTTYNYGAEGVEKMILANGDTVTLAEADKPNSWRSGLSHMYISGPTVFKDLMIIDLRTDASNDFYTQGHNFKLENCDWRQTAYNASPLGGYTWEDWKNHFYLGNHSSLTYTQNVNSNGVVEIDNPSLINNVNIICRGEKTGTSYAYFGNDTTASTLPILYNTNKSGSIQHGVSNLIFNNTTITQLINKKDQTAPTADAVQIILNNGSSIRTNTAEFNADVYIINVADGGMLDATDEVGVYTVESSKKYAYAYAGGDKIYYAEAGKTISVDAPGEYQVGFFDDLSDVTTTYTVDVPGYEFAGWINDGKGTISASAKPVADTDAMYYAMYGGNGDGRTPDAPANTVADAIASINADVSAGKLTAGQEVTVYVASADDWQTYNADVLVGSTSGTPLHHMTVWKNGGGAPAAYSVVLNVQSYDCLNISYMPTNEKLGSNSSMSVNGVTNFDHIAIVDTRFGYREIMADGHNVTFGENAVIAHMDVGSAEADAKWGGKFGYDAGNITVGKYNAGTYNKDIVIRFDNEFNMQGGDRGVFLGSSVSNPTVHNGNVTLYFNNPGIQTSLQWQGSSSTGTNTFGKNLNLVFADAAKIIYQTRNGAAVTIKNLQIISKDGINFRSHNNTADIAVTDIPSNVTVTGGTWILKLAEGVDNFMDVTDTAGTFTVEAGLVARATNDETGAVTISNASTGKLILDEGTYTVEAVDESDVSSLTVTVTFDGVSDGNLYVEGQQFTLPAKDNEVLREFKGWSLDGGATVLAAGTLQTCGAAGSTLAYTSVWEYFSDTTAIYVDAVNGSDEGRDGLTKETAVKTLSKAISLLNARTETTKKVAIVGEYEHSGSIAANTTPIIITGDGSGDSVFDQYNDSIYLAGDITFENITITHTTEAGGKTLYTDSHNLVFGEGVVTDADYNVRLGGDHEGRYGNKLIGTFYSGNFAILEVGNFWVYTTRATASGADVVIDGAHIGTLNFTSNGWLTTQLGCDYTGPVRVLVNSGSVGTIDMTTEAENSAKYTTFKDSVEILSNNGATSKISDQFTAPNGVWIVNAAKAEDGSYLEYTDVKGKYNVIGDMIAVATTPDGQQYASINGVLTVPAGIYTVEFVDELNYLINGDTVSFFSTITLDLSTFKIPLHEGKAFIGWFYADGSAPAYSGTQFKAGDVLTATYIDYVEESGTGLNTTGDFFIKGAQLRLASTENNTVNGIRYIVEMDNSFFTELTQYSSSIINPENPNYGTLILPTTLTKGRSMFYNQPIAVEWNLSDGKLGSKTNPFDLDQAHNATPITTNSVFKKEYTPSAVPAVLTYRRTSTATQYTLCLTGVTEDKFKEFYSVRGYIRYIDANGFERVWYSDYYQTSMHEMANAALNAGETGEFLEEVIDYMEAKPGEGGYYDDYMAANYTNKTLLSGYPSTADTDPNHAMYKLTNGLTVREIEINYSGSTTDDPVEIVHFADTHLNWINEQDLYNAVPSTISTYRGRGWLRNGSSTAAITTALEYGMLFDQIVITGDIMDYFSWGCAEIMQKLIVDRDKNAMLALGNHEPAENMQNDADVGSYYGGRTGIYPLLQEIWPNDIYYYSKIVYNDDGKAKAMCVALNNEQDKYIEEQGTKLQADIAKARELGIPVLIFQHDPICTNNPEDDPRWFFFEKGDWTWMTWASAQNKDKFPQDSSGYILATLYDPENPKHATLEKYDLNGYGTYWVNDPATNALVPPSTAWYSQRGAGKASSDATTMAVYNVIVSNADVVRGVFCGHVHNHMYTEIKASYVKDGQKIETVIPQYCVTANAYGNGNTIKITVR